VAFGRRGMIIGVVFVERDLIRVVTFDERGLI
jgi:hypothetical protein